MGLANELGLGLMGLSGAFSAAQDRALRQRMLDMQMGAQARQDALAQDTLAMHKLDYAMKARKLVQEENFARALLPELFGGAPNFTPNPGQQQPNLVDAPGAAPAASVNYGGPKVSDLPAGNLDLLNYWGRYNNIPEDKLPFLYGIMAVESGGRQWAHNKANTNGTSDHGLMQINDVNLGRLKPGENVYDPTVNTRIGTEIFAEGLKRSGGDALGALGVYNTGKVNPNTPYASRVLQAMGAGANDPGVQPVQLAAGPQRSMTDASGPPPGVQPQVSGITQTWLNDKNKMNMLVAAAAAGVEPAVRALNAMKAMRDMGGFGLEGEAKNLAILLGRPPTQQELVDYKQKTNPQNTVNVNQVQEKEEHKEYGKFLVEDFKSMMADASAAKGELQQIAAAQSLGVETGPLEAFKANAGAVLGAFGISPETIGLNNMQDIGKSQAYQATINNMVLKRAESMKGNLSDKDVKFLKETVAGLDKAPEANRILLSVAERVAKRKVERAAFFQRFRQEKGTFDGASQAFDAWAEQNPLFDGMEIPKTPKASGGYPDGTRLRGQDGRSYIVKNGQPVPEE